MKIKKPIIEIKRKQYQKIIAFSVNFTFYQLISIKISIFSFNLLILNKLYNVCVLNGPTLCEGTLSVPQHWYTRYCTGHLMDHTFG